MFIPILTVYALMRMSHITAVPEATLAAHPVSVLQFLREESAAALQEAAGAAHAVVLSPADLVFEPVDSGPLFGVSRWRGRWDPTSRFLAEMVGGPRDGAQFILASLRPVVSFPRGFSGADLRQAFDAPDRVLPTRPPLEYCLAGYETDSRTFQYWLVD